MYFWGSIFKIKSKEQILKLHMSNKWLYLGGGFDVLHSSHKEWIKKAIVQYSINISEEVKSITIGLNSDNFLNNNY